MKIAISSSGKTLDSALDPRFGRAEYFIIVDPETMDFEVLENRQNFNLPQGAGIQAAKSIADNKADALITGHCGPKAFRVLQAAGVKIMTGASGTVSDVIEQLKAENLKLQPRRMSKATGLNNKKRLCRKPKWVSYNHEGHEEGLSIYLFCLCDLRVLRGGIIMGSVLP